MTELPYDIRSTVKIAIQLVSVDSMCACVLGNLPVE